MIVSSFGRYLSQTAHDHERREPCLATFASASSVQTLDVVQAGLGEADFAAAHGKLAHLAPPDIIEVMMEGEAPHE
jgi:hypothetical protein